jgi:hypothetical protein
MPVTAILVFFSLETEVKRSYMKYNFKTKYQKWKQSMNKSFDLFKKKVGAPTK